MFHDGNRRLQDHFDSRRIADRLEEKLRAMPSPTRIAPSSRARCSSFWRRPTPGPAGLFLQGRHAGLRPGRRADELAFPDYDGNGMFKSLGNVVVNPAVGLLFIDMGEKPRRLRVNGEASVSRDDPLMQRFVGAQLLVRVKARAIFPNCPRYIVTPGATEPSSTHRGRATSRRNPLEGLRRLQGLHPSAAEDAERERSACTGRPRAAAAPCLPIPLTFSRKVWKAT